MEKAKISDVSPVFIAPSKRHVSPFFQPYTSPNEKNFPQDSLFLPLSKILTKYH